ncbi:hypothetical protein HMI55_004590 [Coelomomyces lativittatus]|nr:hypothetical protein HMI56_007687 [Coelomomyces lativittatus]KAJ1514516.1 hypothetical protein HMI55_004590 [Coelomomyces lativittatus]
MHPTLDLTNTASPCQPYMVALHQCHEQGWNKFLGKCNPMKFNLNKCLTEEFQTRRRKNAEEAKLRQWKRKEKEKEKT